MADDLDPLIFDLVEWVARSPRSYAEVMEAWRTSCPRLTVWEDAVERGYLVRSTSPTGQGAIISVHDLGFSFLQTARGAASGHTSAKV